MGTSAIVSEILNKDGEKTSDDDLMEWTDNADTDRELIRTFIFGAFDEDGKEKLEPLELEKHRVWIKKIVRQGRPQLRLEQLSKEMNKPPVSLINITL